MKPSTSERYGTKLLLELCHNRGEEPSIEPYNFAEEERP